MQPYNWNPHPRQGQNQPAQVPYQAVPGQLPQYFFPLPAAAMSPYTPANQLLLSPWQAMSGQFPQTPNPLPALPMPPNTSRHHRSATAPPGILKNHTQHQRAQTPITPQPQTAFHYHRFPSWYQAQHSSKPKMVVLNTQDPKYIRVANLFHKTSPQKTIVKIERIQSKRLYTNFAYKHESFSKNEGTPLKIMMLFHGTRKHDPAQIFSSDSGLDSRLGHGAWGQGTYYAEKSSYSVARYGHKLTNGSEQIFCCLVIVGHYKQLPSDTKLTRPPMIPGTQKCYHSVKGSEGGSDIYITYEPAMSYPDYLITYL